MTESIPDEPDHDDCDFCKKNAWVNGDPLWTCEGQLICEPCWRKDTSPLLTHGQWD